MIKAKEQFEKYGDVARMLCGVLLVFALLSRAFIPVGMMPAMTGGTFKLVICTSMGSKTIDVPADAYNPLHQQQEHKKAQDMDPCPYAPHFATSLLVLACLLFLSIEIVRTVLFRREYVLVVADYIFGNTAPRAPPVSF